MLKIQKINGHPVSYFVNEQQRTVGAIIHDCKYDVICDLYDKHNVCPSRPRANALDFTLPDTLKSIATAHPDDEFDIEVGKRIASKRLRKKYWLKYADRMIKFTTFIRFSSIVIKDAHKALDRSESIDPLIEIHNVSKED